ncbi:MAG: TMEM175 family protein [Pseudomonadota bacterium]
MSSENETYQPPQRGAAMTRLETFTDAAFAFAVTLLAISIDQIPSNYTELFETIKGAPAFAASFALLLVFWRGHQVWSHQYGLEDFPAVLLTALLVCLVLIYVYPLKILFSAAFNSISNGWLPANFDLDSFASFREFLTIYGIGFLLMNLSISALYFYAWTQRVRLNMCAQERFDTLAEVFSWMNVALFAVLSVILAWTLSDQRVALAAWMYLLLIVYSPIYNAVVRGIRRRKLGAAPA